MFLTGLDQLLIHVVSCSVLVKSSLVRNNTYQQAVEFCDIISLIDAMRMQPVHLVFIYCDKSNFCSKTLITLCFYGEGLEDS